MRQIFMRQILANAISKFQKIMRQMLCDKCSKNEVTLIPQTLNGGKILKILTSLPPPDVGLHLLKASASGSAGGSLARVIPNILN
jgi:hypothetical protein